jgi:hypothetical protein
MHVSSTEGVRTHKKSPPHSIFPAEGCPAYGTSTIDLTKCPKVQFVASRAAVAGSTDSDMLCSPIQQYCKRVLVPIMVSGVAG